MKEWTQTLLLKMNLVMRMMKLRKQKILSKSKSLGTTTCPSILLLMTSKNWLGLHHIHWDMVLPMVFMV